MSEVQTQRHRIHRYSLMPLGNILLSLTATNAYGSDSEVKTNYINVILYEYCIPTYTSGSGYGDYITLVQLGSINNATGAFTKSLLLLL